MTLHPRARKIFRYIVDFKREYNGGTPTLREIAEAAGLRTVSAVHIHLDRLEDAGRIMRVRRGPSNRAMMLDVPGGRWEYEGRDAADSLEEE